MAGVGRGRARGQGRAKGRGRATSQPSIQQTTSPSHTRTTRTQSPQSLTRVAPIPSSSSPSSQSSAGVAPIPSSHTPSPHSQTGASARMLGDHSPSSSAIPQMEAKSSTAEDIRWGEKDGDGRIWIKSVPGRQFYPDFKVRGVISTIFKGKFKGAWSSWRKVDDDTIKMWFDEFRASFKWLPEDEDNIKKCFASRGTYALKNALYKVRNGEDKGDWIDPNMLEQLRVEWETDDWQGKSRKNKQNRQSKEGHNMHSGGSISAREHAKRMKVHMNKEPTCFELYERLHRPKGKPNEWFNEEQRKIAEIYQTRIAERQPQSGEGSSQQYDNSIFLDVVGGINKKGRIYGLGSQAANIISSSSTLSSTPIDGISLEEVAAMKATIQALVAELQQKSLEQEMMKQKMDQWEQRFRSLMLGDNLRISLPAPIIEDDNDHENVVSEVSKCQKPIEKAAQASISVKEAWKKQQDGLDVLVQGIQSFSSKETRIETVAEREPEKTQEHHEHDKAESELSKMRKQRTKKKGGRRK